MSPRVPSEPVKISVKLYPVTFLDMFLEVSIISPFAKTTSKLTVQFFIFPYLNVLGPPEHSPIAPPTVETARLDGSGGKNKFSLSSSLLSSPITTFGSTIAVKFVLLISIILFIQEKLTIIEFSTGLVAPQ